MSLLDLIAPGKNKRQKVGESTQTHIRVSEIRDNTVILKNGGLRTVLKTNSINFHLKSEPEQNSIIYSYQSFLNSLEFPIQINVRSKKLDIDDYINQIEKLAEKQTNKLLQDQTFEYAHYIKRLVEYADIMEKEFYVIVPYDTGGNPTKNKFQSFFQRLAPKDSYTDIKKRRSDFNRLKKNLLQRVNIVKTGLENCGLKVQELNTLELIELYYKTYNPKTSQKHKLQNFEEINIENTGNIENEEKKKK